MYESNPPLDSDIVADVAIVGGGYCGLSTAYNLRQNVPLLPNTHVLREHHPFGLSGAKSKGSVRRKAVYFDFAAPTATLSTSGFSGEPEKPNRSIP